MEEKNIEKIKKFWDGRAEQFGDSWQATLGERYLRKIEIDVIADLIKQLKPARVLDVGCGNGYSTKEYAKRFPDVEFYGLDYSTEMIRFATANPTSNCHFTVGDILDANSFPYGEFDLVLTQRCVQNLPDYATQKTAILNLLKKKTPSGQVVLMECSRDGVEQMNFWRKLVLKKALKDVEPWHNTFLVDKNLRDDFCAEIHCFCSTYMFVTRVIWGRLGGVGYRLPQLGNFGYDKMYILK